MMRAVCIVGSPKLNGSTSTIVAEITRALEVGGFQTTVHHLSALNIGYCCGCKTCETTGTCPQTDDVQMIVRDILFAQLVIIASPSYWGDVTGQMKVFIDRCTPYGNTNPARPPAHCAAKGIAVAIRAGGNKQENMHLVQTIEHFLSHLDIPLTAHFTVEGIASETDLTQRPNILHDAYTFGKTLLQSFAQNHQP